MPEDYPRVMFRSGEHLDAKLVERSDDTPAQKSATAKRDLTRWYDSLESNAQTFTMDEALLLCAALNGVRCSAGTLYGVIAISEAIESDQWDVDKDALLERIRNLEYTQSWAVIDAVERAWNAPTYGNIDLKKRVLLVGLAR
jgi:hypothetical protein